MPASSPLRPARGPGPPESPRRPDRPDATRAAPHSRPLRISNSAASGASSVATRTEPPSTLKCGRYPDGAGLKSYPSENKIYLDARARRRRKNMRRRGLRVGLVDAGRTTRGVGRTVGLPPFEVRSGHRHRDLREGVGGALRAANSPLLLANRIPVVKALRPGIHLSHTFTPSPAAPRSARDRRGTRRRAASTPRRGRGARTA